MGRTEVGNRHPGCHRSLPHPGPLRHPGDQIPPPPESRLSSSWLSLKEVLPSPSPSPSPSLSLFLFSLSLSLLTVGDEDSIIFFEEEEELGTKDETGLPGSGRRVPVAVSVAPELHSGAILPGG